MTHRFDIDKLITGLAEGNRLSLSKVITLVESQRPEDIEIKSELMKRIRGWNKAAVKIGVTGSPGVGKSTFLNGFVQLFKGSPHRIAILTIDPSSSTTGGSIMGDKIRMKNLTDLEQVFIRPSPSKGILGGINLTTWETVLVCEAAGYDYIFIETVGVGQSEIEVQYLANEVWYLTMARSGDEIQAMKRGLMEIVDRIIITKADLDPGEAQNTVRLMKQTLKSGSRPILPISFYTLTPFDPKSMEPLHEDLNSIAPAALTNKQIIYWLGKGYQDLIIRKIQSDPRMKVVYNEILLKVKNNAMDYWKALESLANVMDELWKS